MESVRLVLAIGPRLWDLDLLLDELAILVATEEPVELSNYFLAQNLAEKGYAKKVGGRYLPTGTTEALLETVKAALQVEVPQ